MDQVWIAYISVYIHIYNYMYISISDSYIAVQNWGVILEFFNCGKECFIHYETSCFPL